MSPICHAPFSRVKIVKFFLETNLAELLFLEGGFGVVAAEQLSAQQIAVVLQKGQIQIAEKLDVLVLDFQLLRRVEVDDLEVHKNQF
jgi:hypothetical protein